MDGLFADPTFRGLATALTLHERRHVVLATNLANVDTPGYRARELDFGTVLRDAFGGAAEAVEPTRGVAVVEDATAPAKADGNTVDLDLEMARLGANGGRYVALARILHKRLMLLRQAMEVR